MPDDRWKPLVGTPSKSPILNIVVPDLSPGRSTTSDGEIDADSPTLLPPSPGASWIHQRRQAQYVSRPPVWKICKPDQVYDALQDAEDVGAVLQEKSLQLPGIDPIQVLADVFNEKPLVVNMMTSTAPTEHKKLRVRNNLDSQERPMVESNLDSQKRPAVEKKVVDDDAPMDSGYPSTRNTAPHSPSASLTSLERLQAFVFTNSEPFAPRPERPVRTYSPPISPGTKDPLGPYPANEAQAVNVEGLSPPRIEDHPSLNSDDKPEITSVAGPSNAGNETAVQQGKPPEKVPRNTITKRVASLFAGNKDPPKPGFEVVRRGQSHYSPKRVVLASEQVASPQVSEQVVNPQISEQVVNPQVSEQIVNPQASQSVQKERVKHKKPEPRTKDVQSLAVSIPLQDVPLRIKLHVSGIPRDHYIIATIVSGPPSDAVVEKSTMVATAAKDHLTGVEESIYPIEMSGALSEGKRSIFDSLNKSIGRTVKRSSLLSRVFHQSEGGNAVSSIGIPPFRGEGPTFQPSAASSDARRGTGHTLDDISLNFPSERPDSSPSEPVNQRLPETRNTDLKSRIGNSASEKGAVEPVNHSVPETGNTDLKSRIGNSVSEKGAAEPSASTPVPEGGSPAHWAAIQTNASRIARQSPNISRTSVDQWVAAHTPPDGVADNIQRMSTRAGNIASAPQLQQPAIPTAGSHQHSMRQSEEGTPAGDWAFGGRRRSVSPHDCPSLVTDSSSRNHGSGSTIPAPPPATRPMPFRPNDMARENRVPEYAYPHNLYAPEA